MLEDLNDCVCLCSLNPSTPVKGTFTNWVEETGP